jgi:hypothetical protein
MFHIVCVVLPRARGVPAEVVPVQVSKVKVAGLGVPVCCTRYFMMYSVANEKWLLWKPTFVRVPNVPVDVQLLAVLTPVERVVANALLSENAHVYLESHEGKDGETEHGQDYHVTQVLHRLNHRTHYRLQTCEYLTHVIIIVVVIQVIIIIIMK